MSIWASLQGVGEFYNEDDPQRPPGVVASFATGWSNHYPDPDNGPEKVASVGLALVPSWCVPGHRDTELYDHVGPWLRLGVCSHEHDFHEGGKPTGNEEQADVVMDEDAVRSLVEQLTSWLDLPKVRPTEDS